MAAQVTIGTGVIGGTTEGALVFKPQTGVFTVERGSIKAF